MKGLETLQSAVARALMTLALLQTPVLIVLSVARSAHSGIVDALVIMFGVVPLVVYLLDRPSRVVGEALAVSLVGQAGVLVFLLKGHPWQVEMHFYFFVVLAMLAGFCERSILVVAAALIAAHHLVLDSLVPAAIYPGGGNVIRLGLHAAFVVVETGMLVFFSHIIRASFIEAANAREVAEWSASELASAGSTLEEELSSTTAKAKHLETTLSAFQIEVGDSLKRLVEASAALDSTADSFSKTVTHTTKQTATVSAAAGDANKKVGEVASAGRTYLASLSEVGVTSITSVHLGEAAVVEALNTVAAIDELITMSSQIDEAASLITALAMQTNLLALNATIEAGRAGVHGRGFAVVASEVKSLASEAARASTTITKTVAGIQTSTRRSAGAIGSILVAVRELKANAAMVSEAVEERVQLAAAIASNADAAARHVEHVSSGIDAIEVASIHNTKSADVLQGAASEVALQTEAIRERLRDFAVDLGRLHGDTHRHLGREAA